MRFERLERVAVVMELDIPGGLVLYTALDYGPRHRGRGPMRHADALATAIIARAFAAFLLDRTGRPTPPRGRWATWAPGGHCGEPPCRMPSPAKVYNERAE